jgi:hypothetical protein
MNGGGRTSMSHNADYAALVGIDWQTPSTIFVYGRQVLHRKNTAS